MERKHLTDLSQIITKTSELKNYPCQALYGGKWVSAIAVAEAKLRTGYETGDRFDLIYLVEFTLEDAKDDSYRVKRRRWLNAEQVQLGEKEPIPFTDPPEDRIDPECLVWIERIADRAALTTYCEVMGWDRQTDYYQALTLMQSFGAIAKLTPEQLQELADRTQEKG